MNFSISLKLALINNIFIMDEVDRIYENNESLQSLSTLFHCVALSVNGFRAITHSPRDTSPQNVLRFFEGCARCCPSVIS